MFSRCSPRLYAMPVLAASAMSFLSVAAALLRSPKARRLDGNPNERGLSDRREPHEVVRRQRAPDLLQAPARHQAAEVDREETGGAEQSGDRGLGRGVVAGQEDHPATARLVRICAQYVSRKRVGGLD